MASGESSSSSASEELEEEHNAKFEDKIEQVLSNTFSSLVLRERTDLLLPYDLAMIHSIRAVYKFETNPKSESILEYIEASLQYWSRSSITLPDNDKQIQDPLFLLLNLADVLTLKGFTQWNTIIIKLIVKCSEWAKLGVKDCVRLLWGSRSLTHALSIEPIDDTLLAGFPEEVVEELKFIHTWQQVLEGPMLQAFEQKLGFSELDSTITQVKRMTMSENEANGSNRKSIFFTGHIYHSLSETLLAAGRVHEAIFYAEQALQLHEHLLNDHYEYTIIRSRGTKHAYLIRDLRLKESVGLKIWPSSEDVESFYVRPWKIVQCYLESCVQVAHLHELIGDDFSTRDLASRGLSISESFNLPIFQVVFSSIRGKLYGERLMGAKSKKAILHATELLTKNKIHMCPKCRLFLQVEILASQNPDIFDDANDWKNRSATALNELFSVDFLENQDCHPLDVGSSKDRKGTCNCNGMNCCNCVFVELKETGLVKDAITLQWDLARRRISIKLLNRIEIISGGKYRRETSLSSASILFHRKLSLSNKLPEQPTPMLSQMVELKFFGDKFGIDLAIVLYNMSWDYLKFRMNDIRCSQTLHDVISWLKYAFILCQEVPSLLRKVSMMLSTIYVFFSSKRLLSPTNPNNLLEGHWAAFFHQASIGNYMNSRFFNKAAKDKLLQDMGKQGSSTTDTNMECRLSRVTPSSVVELNNFVTKFFEELPYRSIICLSLVRDPLATFLQELMDYPPSIFAWVLISRVSSKYQPIVSLLPMYSCLPGSGSFKFFRIDEEKKPWECPWGESVIDVVAPDFRCLMREINLALLYDGAYLSRQRDGLTILDKHLGEFLRMLQEQCFGTWSVLLDEQSSSQVIDRVESDLFQALESECLWTVNRALLRSILAKGSELNPETIIQLLESVKNGCIIGQARAAEIVTSQSRERIVQLLTEAMKEVREFKDERFTNGEPLILVLDQEVQAIPWESIPMLGEQEIYRMPSISSIRWVLDKNIRRQESGASVSVSVMSPSVDPSSSFHFGNPESANPERDIMAYALYHNNFLKYKKYFKGKFGIVLSEDEFAKNLKGHDIHWYWGHGNGMKFISGTKIEELENCAASNLLGCRSCLLKYGGSYVPTGAPLHYLIAGAPFIIGNLWIALGGDMVAFGDSLLRAWSNEFESHEEDINNYPRMRRIGSFLLKAKETSTYKYIGGAARICFGVPTYIRKKKDPYLPKKRKKAPEQLEMEPEMSRKPKQRRTGSI